MDSGGRSRFSAAGALSSFVKVTLAVVAATALAAGCKASMSVGGENTLDKAEVQEEAAKQIAAKAKMPKPAVTCPDDLAAEVGATLDCYLVAPGDSTKLPVHIEVTKVGEDGRANFDISVGSTPIR